MHIFMSTSIFTSNSSFNICYAAISMLHLQIENWQQNKYIDVNVNVQVSNFSSMSPCDQLLAEMLLEEKEEEVISSANVSIDFPTSPSNNFSYCQLRQFQVCVALIKIEFGMFSSSHPKVFILLLPKAMKGESRLFFFPYNPCGQQQTN